MAQPQRRFILHSRWTAEVPLASSEGERHFTVIAVAGRGVDTQLTLRAVLTHRDYQVPFVDLADAARWTSGWRSLRGG
ncbi:MAG: TIGR02450 family Trp-rich protein [Kofleriaceae bacterium]|nr:TIGR02450 family Trp-rich protein [Kofleriaceae bacterium]